jgi:hypothetical protein
VHGTEEVYEAIVADYPECRVSIEDLSQDLYFDAGSVEEVQARDAAYTEIKVG